MRDEGQWPNEIVCVLSDDGKCPALFFKACVCMKMAPNMYQRLAEEKDHGEGNGVQGGTEANR